MRQGSMTRARRRRRGVFAVVGAAIMVAGLTAACGSDQGAASAPGLTTVTFGMDYLPGPAHNGLAYGIQHGLFKKRGIEVKLIPYTEAPPDTLIAAGKADLGLNWGATRALADFAQGMPVTAVFALYQHQPGLLAVLADSTISRPADLAGKKLGTFGDPIDPATADTMITTDGGTGTVQPVVVGSSIYHALSSRKIDAALIYASDIYEFEETSGKIRTWDPVKFGVPDSYGNLMLANNTFLAKKPQVAKDFLAAFTEGYEKSLTDRQLTNDDLVKQFPGQIDRKMVDYVTKIQSDGLFVDPDGGVGTQDLARWRETLTFMKEHDLLVDSNGKKLDSNLDLAKFVTDDYLPGR